MIKIQEILQYLVNYNFKKSLYIYCINPKQSHALIYYCIKCRNIVTIIYSINSVLILYHLIIVYSVKVLYINN